MQAVEAHARGTLTDLRSESARESNLHAWSTLDRKGPTVGYVHWLGDHSTISKGFPRCCALVFRPPASLFLPPSTGSSRRHGRLHGGYDGTATARPHAGQVDRRHVKRSRDGRLNARRRGSN